MTSDQKLEALIEELCEEQIEEQELEVQALRIAREADVDALNDLPRLYRLEVKRLLNDHGDTERAAQIKD